MPISVDITFGSGDYFPVVKYTFVIDSDLHVFRNTKTPGSIEPTGPIAYSGPILEDHQWMSNAPVWRCGEYQYLIKGLFYGNDNGFDLASPSILFCYHNGAWAWRRIASGSMSTFPDGAIVEDEHSSWLYLLGEGEVKEICLPLKDWKHFELIHIDSGLSSRLEPTWYGVFFLDDELRIYSLLHTALITSFPFKWNEDLDIRVWDDSVNQLEDEDMKACEEHWFGLPQAIISIDQQWRIAFEKNGKIKMDEF